MYDEYLSVPDLQKILELSSHRPMFHTVPTLCQFQYWLGERGKMAE